jgi:threonine dehydrogenase-like Zn-dependent dehydrogenase
LEGNYHFCQNGALRTTIGINRNGGFARVCSVPLEQVAVLPANVTFEQGLFTFVYFCLLLLVYIFFGIF